MRAIGSSLDNAHVFVPAAMTNTVRGIGNNQGVISKRPKVKPKGAKISERKPSITARTIKALEIQAIPVMKVFKQKHLSPTVSD